MNESPLHIAAEKNLIDIGEVLITKGANINANDVLYWILWLSLLMKIIKNR